MADIGALLNDLAAVPSLPGAACRSEREVFDRTVPGAVSRSEAAQARRAAKKICAACPCLQACTAWVDGLEPFSRPLSITAGRTHHREPGARRTYNTRWS
jgi:hypothetical protein